MSLKLQSDIISLEDYFSALVSEDPEIETFVLESGNNPWEMERFDELSKSKNFRYPAMAMLMPVISGEDNEMHNFEAKQDIAYAFLYPTGDKNQEKMDAYKQGQLAGWRFLRYLRRDAKAGKFRIDKMAYTMAPFEYGSDGCVGQYVNISIITSTNYLIGV